MNTITVVGNLTRDPELRYTPTGQAVVKFGIAVNRFYTNRNGEKIEQTDFFNVNAINDPFWDAPEQLGARAVAAATHIAGPDRSEAKSRSVDTRIPIRKPVLDDRMRDLVSAPHGAVCAGYGFGRRMAQRSSWMRSRLPAGSRKAQSRTPYGCSVGSWTTSASPDCSRSKVPSRSSVDRLMLA
jgi:Single-strand binding protein family